MLVLVLNLLFVRLQGLEVYITDCGSESGCGTVDGCKWESDGVAPSEGLFGTTCTCPDGIEEVCTYDGQTVYQCKDGKYPSCDVSCQKSLCLTNTSNGKKSNASIVSACPKYHPQNAQQCCEHKNDAYCTCIIRDTIDCASDVYNNLGGSNTYATVTEGYCT